MLIDFNDAEIGTVRKALELWEIVCRHNSLDTDTTLDFNTWRLAAHVRNYVENFFNQAVDVPTAKDGRS